MAEQHVAGKGYHKHRSYGSEVTENHEVCQHEEKMAESNLTMS
jgi:hypothetical protein